MKNENKSILIVDDDEVGRKLLTRYLHEFQLYEAADGVEGWDIFTQYNIDVVITDLRMPNRDGLGLLKMIRNDSPTTPVIILSGAGKMRDVIETLRLGATDYLEKPLQNEEIVLHTIRKAFNILRLEEIDRNYQNNLELEIERKTRELRTELKARKKAQDELLHAQKEWQRTFDAIPDLIAIIDDKYRIIRANKAMLDAVDKQGGGADSHCFCFSNVHGEEKPIDLCPHAQLLQDGKKHRVEIFEERLGGHFEVTVVPFYHEDGTTLEGSVHIARNINDRKNIEEEREGMQVQLLHTQKLESVGQLAAGIAHEINTPVQFVSTNNEFLNESFGFVSDLIEVYERLYQSAKDGKAGEELLRDVAEAREEADWEYLADEIPTALKQNQEGLKRVASIVMAMKEFSHPGSKEKESRSLNEIIETTIIVARNEWKYVAEIDRRLDPDLPHVMCFSDDIGQVVLNMIINAAHAIEERLGKNPVGEKGTITIRTSVRGEYAEIQIEDTGMGMPQHIREKVFDPFFTTKGVGKGTGQGLAIAWNIVKDKHKGEIQVESSEGKGTTFIIRLPLSS